MVVQLKEKIESSLFKLCRQFLESPSKFSEKVFEPLQAHLITNKFQRSYKGAPVVEINNPNYSKEVKLYWNEKLGVYLNPVWHHVITSLNKNYDPRYISPEIWWKYFHKKLNYSVHHDPLIADKNFLDLYIRKEHLPKTVFKVVKGGFFDANNKQITQEKAEEILIADTHEKFVKPSKLFQGREAFKLTTNDGIICTRTSEISFDELVQRMGKDFIVQYTVDQHEKIAKVHPNSLNTLRVNTVRLGTNVHFLNGAIKFGADDNDADNTGNGLLCAIDKETHKLSGFGYNRRLQTFGKHINTGIDFSKFGKLPHYQEAIDLCKETHQDLLYHDFAAWDVAITKNGIPLIIELNSKPNVLLWQIIFEEPFFSDVTDEVIQYVLTK